MEEKEEKPRERDSMNIPPLDIPPPLTNYLPLRMSRINSLSDLPGLLKEESLNALKFGLRILRSPWYWIAVTAIAVPFMTLDYNYKKQAQEIHRLYTVGELQRKDEGVTNRLTVYEELSALRQRGQYTEGWAIDFFKKTGQDYYFDQKRF